MNGRVSGSGFAEVIYHPAYAEKEYMGLISFKGDRPHLKDTEIAKNYFDEKELRAILISTGEKKGISMHH